MEDLIVLTFFNAGVAQLVEHHVANVNVAGPSPVSRSKVIHIKVDFLFLWWCISYSTASQSKGCNWIIFIVYI